MIKFKPAPPIWDVYISVKCCRCVGAFCLPQGPPASPVGVFLLLVCSSQCKNEKGSCAFWSLKTLLYYIFILTYTFAVLFAK